MDLQTLIDEEGRTGTLSPAVIELQAALEDAESPAPALIAQALVDIKDAAQMPLDELHSAIEAELENPSVSLMIAQEITGHDAVSIKTLQAVLGDADSIGAKPEPTLPPVANEDAMPTAQTFPENAPAPAVITVDAPQEVAPAPLDSTPTSDTTTQAPDVTIVLQEAPLVEQEVSTVVQEQPASVESDPSVDQLPSVSALEIPGATIAAQPADAPVLDASPDALTQNFEVVSVETTPADMPQEASSQDMPQETSPVADESAPVAVESAPLEAPALVDVPNGAAVEQPESVEAATEPSPADAASVTDEPTIDAESPLASGEEAAVSEPSVVAATVSATEQAVEDVSADVATAEPDAAVPAVTVAEEQETDGTQSVSEPDTDAKQGEVPVTAEDEETKSAQVAQIDAATATSPVAAADESKEPDAPAEQETV